MTGFDPSALTDPLDRADMREWARANGVPGVSLSATRGNNTVGSLILFVGALAVFVGVGAAVVGQMQNAFASMSAIGGGLVLVLGLVAVGSLLGLVFLIMASLSARERAYRLSRFAAANGLSYRAQLDSPALPGMIFGRGKARKSRDLVRGTTPRFVEFANYSYVTGSGDDKKTHTWGYVAIKLDVPLPHIVLDAKGNNAALGSNLPTALDRNQRLSLEGDFDRYFDLYCPSGYGRDALYLFTPDIMARFIDNAAQLDVEIVDDWIFFYAKRELSTLDPATWAWLFGTVHALLDKFAQWARWRDDRPTLAASADAAAGEVPFDAAMIAAAPPPGVAPEGRRLRRGIPWSIVIAFGGMLLLYVLASTGVLGPLFGGFFGR